MPWVWPGVKKPTHLVTQPLINSLASDGAIWKHGTGSILGKVMAWCLTATSHYLNNIQLSLFCGVRAVSPKLLNRSISENYAYRLNVVVAHEPHNVSNHQQLHCLSNRLFMLTTKETSKLHITDPLWGEPLLTGVFLSQGASNVESFSMS